MRVVPLLKPVSYHPGEIIWKKNDFSGSIYFIINGKINFYIPVYNNKLEKLSDQEVLINIPDISTAHKTPNPDIENSQNAFQKIGSKLAKKEIIDVIYKTMRNGAYFGDVDVIFRRRRNCICKAVSKVDAFCFSQKDFENILRLEHPHIWKDMKEQAVVKE